MWRNVVQQTGNGLLVIAEYFLKITGIFAFFTVVGTRGTFSEKLLASFNPFALFPDSADAVYRQVTNMAEIIVDYNTLEMPVFTELYAKGTLDGVIQGLNAGAGYIVAVDQNVTLAPAGTFTAAFVGLGIFFVAGSVLRIIRQRDSNLLRIRLEKRLWNRIMSGSVDEVPSQESQLNTLRKQGLDGRKEEKKQERKEEENEYKEPVTPTSHGKLKLVKLPEVSEARYQKQMGSGNKNALSSQKQPEKKEQGTEPESSDWNTQSDYASDQDKEQPAEPEMKSAKDGAAHFSSNGNGQLNGDGHHKNKGSEDEELEKSLVEKLSMHEEQEENPPEKKPAPPQNCSLNEFLERARSS